MIKALSQMFTCQPGQRRGLLLTVALACLAPATFAAPDGVVMAAPAQAEGLERASSPAEARTEAPAATATEELPEPVAAAAAQDKDPAAESPPVAENVDLSEPVSTPIKPAGESEAPLHSPAPPDEPVARAQRSIVLLGTEVKPGTSTRLSWSPTQSFAGIDVQTPVLVVNGVRSGPVLCLTGAVHGDELNGIEIVRRVLYDLKPEELAGAVIGVPIVNLQGFRRGSRYLSDRRDLNRYFPGNPNGSAASRIAHSFFHDLMIHCDALVDIHTGSFHRTNLPQLRADLSRPEVVRLTQGFGSTVVLKSEGAKGTLRRAAVERGIAAVTLEAGAPQRVQEKSVSHGVKGIQTLLNELGMVRKITLWGTREPVFYRSRWVRASQGGLLVSDVALGEKVRKGQVLGTVTDPISNVRTEVRASERGRVLGMALNQFVMPGFAAFHIGIERDVTEMTQVETPDPDAAQPTDTDVGESASPADNLEDSAPRSNDPEALDDSE